MVLSTQPTGRKRLIHHLDTPDVSFDDQDAILEILLSPIGQHRRHHTKPSKGKRSGKTRADSAADASVANETHVQTAPQKPELSAHVDVGFNSITRKLEETSKETPKARGDTSAQATGDAKRPYSMIFVARGNQSSAFNCHFPRMVGAATRASPSEERTRLVGFSKPCSERLSAVLGVARVSSVAVMRDAPGAEALWAFVQKTVSPVDTSWLEESKASAYRPTQIGSTETIVGAKKAKITA
ncbi:RNase p and RNase mrp subunit [Purpureocillium lilacinum]|uniref:RNase p and RNase mrp subunit n=1 Tax=Purpureocillium lilacinum TaxID=33203 RepID=A0A179HXH0_PURLI|nr:RNase p and RNase mrp subunit [Purpureocillium lilacinum]OAQ95087.1 RNase p and RNase mrp subunit [Purpureocillium lilacinum]